MRPTDIYENLIRLPELSKCKFAQYGSGKFVTTIKLYGLTIAELNLPILSQYSYPGKDARYIAEKQGLFAKVKFIDSIDRTKVKFDDSISNSIVGFNSSEITFNPAMFKMYNTTQFASNLLNLYKNSVKFNFNCRINLNNFYTILKNRGKVYLVLTGAYDKNEFIFIEPTTGKTVTDREVLSKLKDRISSLEGITGASLDIYKTK